jgi:GNAT superfamily N-acetyltransferase
MIESTLLQQFYKKFPEYRDRIDYYYEFTNAAGGLFFFDRDNLNYIAFCFKGKNIISNRIEGYINIFINSNIYLPFFKNELERIILDCSVYFSDIRNEYELLYITIEGNDNFLGYIHNGYMNKKFTYASSRISKTLNHHNNIDSSHHLSPYNIKYIDNNNSIHLKNVMECIKKAYINGLSADEKEKMTEIDVYKKRIEKYYTPLFNKQRLIFIAENDNKFVGHATYELLENKTEASLLDIFILEEYRGTGATKLLSKIGEDHCKSLGITKLYGTINKVKDQELTFLVKILEKEGWRNESHTYNLRR